MYLVVSTIKFKRIKKLIKFSINGDEMFYLR